jgi:hypothetical protein
MSYFELTVGRLPEDLADGCADALERLGIPDSSAWQFCAPKIAAFNLFNLATIVSFLDYVAKLEGFESSSKALEHTRFRNLPWWEMSIWLPLPFQPPPDLVIQDSGYLFLGSSHGLLTELAEIQRLSDLGLGAIPPGYEHMLADDDVFWQTDFSESSHTTFIQWIWRGLHDAAELSIVKSAPIQGM